MEVFGTPPQNGLLVSNHLSYLDILVFSALTPCVFVSKSEVRHWPVLGWLARAAGTIFIRRERRLDVRHNVRAIQQALESGVVVVLFPEGTSSGGQTILPFHSALLEPVGSNFYNLSVAYIEYGISDGDPSEEVCFWRDMQLLPHLFNLFSKNQIQARVAFRTGSAGDRARKSLAQTLRLQVIQCKMDVTQGRTTGPISGPRATQREPAIEIVG